MASLIVIFPHEGSAFIHAVVFHKTETSLKTNACKVDAVNTNQNKSCQTKFFNDADILKLQEESLKKVEALQEAKDFQEFQEHILTKNDEILNSKTFQATVTELKQAQKNNAQSLTEVSNDTSRGELYIFVSFSLGEKALLNLAQDAKQFDATLVLRGFVDGSYTKTAKALQKIIQKTGQGFIIDPELFTLFAVGAVPIFILTNPFQLHAMERIQTPLHDRMQGHVSARYALETFSQMGDLKVEAMTLLQKKESK